ncbi:MAG: hypothetical protein NTY87_07455 [Planctomycetia bacterium]|nr:hypothetical protein [Planctomycetia bacterium]
MLRSGVNPFYYIVGFVGFLFTITASSYCLFVLRGVRSESASAGAPHALELIMDRYGTSLLTGQIIVLALATVGAVAVDHFNGERIRRERAEAAQQAAGANPAHSQEPFLKAEQR